MEVTGNRVELGYPSEASPPFLGTLLLATMVTAWFYWKYLFESNQVDMDWAIGFTLGVFLVSLLLLILLTRYISYRWFMSQWKSVYFKKNAGWNPNWRDICRARRLMIRNKRWYADSSIIAFASMLELVKLTPNARDADPEIAKAYDRCKR